MRKKPNFSKGFTLIELLVVIAIIGLLSSVVLASLSTARMKANDAKRQVTLKQVSIALELYALDNGGKYPYSSAIFDYRAAVAVTENNLNFANDNTQKYFFTKFINKFTRKANAASSHPLCVNFVKLFGTTGTPGPLTNYMKGGVSLVDPIDDGSATSDTCYKYLPADNGTYASAYTNYQTQRFNDGTYKKIGTIVGNTDFTSAHNLCTKSNSITSTRANGTYPVYNSSLTTPCSGGITPLDTIVGVSTY